MNLNHFDAHLLICWLTLKDLSFADGIFFYVETDLNFLEQCCQKVWEKQFLNLKRSTSKATKKTKIEESKY